MSAACRSKGGIVLNVASSGIAALLLEGDSELAELLRMTKLIIWDEAPMVNRHCYEAFDRTMRDICHTDPSTPSEQNHCTVMKLTVNMRLGSGSNSSKRKEIQNFADWIVYIENGKMGEKSNGDANVESPNDMLIPDFDDHIGSIIHETYPDLLQNIYDLDYFQERAILAPTHE
ncbi:ATP-dependent DNA helicase PIF1-like protein [Tanacetum coccineum]